MIEENLWKINEIESRKIEIRIIEIDIGKRVEKMGIEERRNKDKIWKEIVKGR